MKFRLLPACLLAAAAASGSSAPPATSDAPPPGVWETGHFNLLPRSLQRNPRLDVMINTEFTEAGIRAPQASAAHPVYYTGSDGGQVTVGQVLGGEVPPPASELAKILVEALRQSGYRPARAKHPPQIYIHYRWGSFNQLPPLGGPPDDLDRLNLLERAALVGGGRFAVQMADAMNAGTLGFFEESSPRVNFLVQEAHDNRYFIIATGYDYAAASQGRRVVLWSTRISTNSNGVMMSESLPQLVAAAAPYFGHPTNGPVRLNRPVVKDGHVEIGTPTVKETLPSDTPEATPATPAPAPAPAP